MKKPSDFKIGDEFDYHGKTYRVTDIGTRTIVVIRIDKADIASRIRKSEIDIRSISREEAEKAGWFKGPPYAVAEHVFDEDHFAGMEDDDDEWEEAGEAEEAGEVRAD